MTPRPKGFSVLSTRTASPPDQAPDPGVVARPGEPAVRVRDLTLGYGRAPVIEGLDLDIPAGRTTAIIGANGCGKSTLLRALGRQLTPMRGTIELAGRDVARSGARDHARTAAFLPQSPLVPEGLTVAELVARGRHPHRRWWGRSSGDDDAVAHALEATGTAAFAHRRVDELSGGQRQRVWVALVLAQATPVLLLDEPCSFLDLAHQLDILDLVRALPLPGDGGRASGDESSGVSRGDSRGERRTVVAVLHELTLAARVADHLVALAGGTVVAEGPPAEVITPDNLRRVFDLEADVISDPLTGSPVVLPRGRSAGEHRRKDLA